MSNELSCSHLTSFKQTHGLEPFKITQKWLVNCSTHEARQVNYYVCLHHLVIIKLLIFIYNKSCNIYY